MKAYEDTQNYNSEKPPKQEEPQYPKEVSPAIRKTKMLIIFVEYFYNFYQACHSFSFVI